MNETMQIEREHYLGAKPYERSYERNRHANGYKPKTVKARVGEVTFDIPQVREGGFYPQALEKGLRSELALLIALAEMYVQGVSTRKAVFIGIPWVRCQFHLQQHAGQYVPRVGMRREAAEDTPALAAGASVRTIFSTPSRDTAETCLKKAVEKYVLTAPKLAGWMDVNIPEGFTVFSFLKEHQRRLRTSNQLERLNQKIKRWTRVVRVFLNEQSCLRLISVILMEIGEEWEYGRLYLQMEPG